MAAECSPAKKNVAALLVTSAADGLDNKLSSLTVYDRQSNRVRIVRGLQHARVVARVLQNGAFDREHAQNVVRFSRCLYPI